MPNFRLGLKPPVPGAVKLRFATYANYRKLPTPPAVFGHYDLVQDWGMLANDQWGCCAEAGPCHQEMLWTIQGGNPARFDDAATLRNYAEIAGFNPDAGPPGDNPTDNGSAISDVARFWRHTGIIDADGKRHKVAAYCELGVGDIRELATATYLFQSVGLGFEMPASAMTQTERNEPWDVVPGSHIEGGHYVPCVGRQPNGNFICVTWGRTQEFTPRFYQKYNNQGICCFSTEMLKNAKSIDGFDDKLLREDLAIIGR